MTLNLTTNKIDDMYSHFYCGFNSALMNLCCVFGFIPESSIWLVATVCQLAQCLAKSVDRQISNSWRTAHVGIGLSSDSEIIY